MEVVNMLIDWAKSKLAQSRLQLFESLGVVPRGCRMKMTPHCHSGAELLSICPAQSSRRSEIGLVLMITIDLTPTTGANTPMWCVIWLYMDLAGQ